MRFAKFAIFPFFLTACQLGTQQFELPEQVEFQGQSYVKVTDTRIDEMRHLLYLPADGVKNPEQWNKGILLFLDKNSQNKTLQDRVNLRKAAFAEQAGTQAEVAVIGNELRSGVIYPPTERFQNVQLEVSRGRNLQCGYGQIQFADKRSDFAPNLQKTAVYQPSLVELSKQFAWLPWQIGCK